MKNIEDALLNEAKAALSSIMADGNLRTEDRVRAAEIILGYAFRGDNVDTEKE